MPLCSPFADRQREGKVRRARPLLGTLVEIAVSARASSARLHETLDAAFSAIEQVHRLMSYHLEGSDVSRLNRHAAAEPQRIDPRTYRVLESAVGMARLSNGAFDPCIAPLLEESGHLPRQAAAVDPEACWRDIELLPDYRVHFRRPLRVDLGGIAKGYAVDVAVDLMRARLPGSLVVNAGGDLRVAGDMQEICIRDAHTLRPGAHRLMLRNEAMATSGTYYSRRDDPRQRQRCALVDLRTRTASPGKHSISVVAPDCMTADALTKVVLFAEVAVAQEALKICDARAYLQAGLPARDGDDPA